MALPVVTQGVAKELADLTRDAGNSFVALSATILQTYAPQLHLWATRNLYRCKDKLDEENAKRREAGKELIPIRFALPALTKVAEEDDDDMLALWARLFANLQDPKRQLAPNRIYIHILSEMEPLDAKLLKHTIDVVAPRQAAHSATTNEIIGMTGTVIDELVPELMVSKEQINLSLHNLARLGCFRSQSNESYLVVEPQPAQVSPWTQGWPWLSTDEATFHLTSLGYAVVEACREE